MDIGTAKVTQEEMQGIHHELIDVQNYNEPYNVKVFQEKMSYSYRRCCKKRKVSYFMRRNRTLFKSNDYMTMNFKKKTKISPILLF